MSSLNAPVRLSGIDDTLKESLFEHLEKASIQYRSTKYLQRLVRDYLGSSSKASIRGQDMLVMEPAPNLKPFEGLPVPLRFYNILVSSVKTIIDPAMELSWDHLPWPGLLLTSWSLFHDDKLRYVHDRSQHIDVADLSYRHNRIPYPLSFRELRLSLERLCSDGIGTSGTTTLLANWISCRKSLLKLWNADPVWISGNRLLCHESLGFLLYQAACQLRFTEIHFTGSPIDDAVEIRRVQIMIRRNVDHLFGVYNVTSLKMDPESVRPYDDISFDDRIGIIMLVAHYALDTEGGDRIFWGLAWLWAYWS